jgi:hypothetical protein
MNPRYGRDSRYRRTPTVTRTDHTGRVLPVDDARPRPLTGGSFTHTVDGGDRLDHLGQRYYGKPHKWWAIADANPDFASPLALLGLDPVTAVRVTLPAPAPRWKVLADLHALVGVEDAVLDEDGDAITVTFNQVTVGADAVLRTVRAAAGAPDALSGPADRLGKPVVVPPEPTP